MELSRSRKRNTVFANTQAELWRFDVPESLDVAFAGGDDAGQSVENTQGCGLFDGVQIALARSVQTILLDMIQRSERPTLGGVRPMRSKSSALSPNSARIFS